MSKFTCIFILFFTATTTFAGDNNVADSFNVTATPVPWGFSAIDWGWFYTPSVSYNLNMVKTNFSALDGVPPWPQIVTVEIYLLVPEKNGGIGVILLGSASFDWRIAIGTLNGPSFSDIPLAVGQNYFIAFRNIDNIGANSAQNGTRAMQGCDDIDGNIVKAIISCNIYPLSEQVDYPILQFNGYANNLPLQITPATLPNASCVQPYGPVTFAATGGSGTGYTWSVSSGSLPLGFSLNPNTGVLSSTGCPVTILNPNSFTVQVTDSAGNTAPQPPTFQVTYNNPSSQPLTLNIACPTPVNVSLEGYASSTTGLPTSIHASFIPANNDTLNDNASKCGLSGFDWVQQISLYDGSPVSPPNFDPLPGQTTPPSKSAPYPFYYKLSDIDKFGNSLCIAYLNGICTMYMTSNEGMVLNFTDKPVNPDFGSNPLCSSPASCTTFTTQLVGICSASTPASACTGSAAGFTWIPLYQWLWNTNWAGNMSCAPPFNQVCGTGGITITSLNGSPPMSLNVGNVNSASGTVVSNEGSINCSTTCSANYTRGTAVTLTAIPVSGYEFTGWGGACSGYGNACTVTTTNAAQFVTTNFAPLKTHQPLWRRAINSIKQGGG